MVCNKEHSTYMTWLWGIEDVVEALFPCTVEYLTSLADAKSQALAKQPSNQDPSST